MSKVKRSTKRPRYIWSHINTQSRLYIEWTEVQGMLTKERTKCEHEIASVEADLEIAQMRIFIYEMNLQVIKAQRDRLVSFIAGEEPSTVVTGTEKIVKNENLHSPEKGVDTSQVGREEFEIMRDLMGLSCAIEELNFD